MNMTELKTLRDIEKPIPMNTKYVIMDESKNGLALSNDLRVAAREWIKELRNVHCNTSVTIGGFRVDNILDETEEPLVIIAWIKHFFNIEE